MTRGTPVVDEETSEEIGRINGIVLDPDTGKVEGFAVRLPGFPAPVHYLSSLDVVRWGTKAWIRDPGAVAPLEELLRLKATADSPRRILGQSIRTESGRDLGTCADVQFDTLHFATEWLFPRRWWRWGLAIPVTQVLEVRDDAVIVRETAAPVPEAPSVLPEVPETVKQILDPMPEPV